jgi:hypothetical protein
MRPIIRLPILAALPLILTACQTYETTYVERPAVRRTYVVERGYDPYDAPRPIYRDRSYDAYGDDYRPRRPSRGSYGYEQPYRGPVAREQPYRGPAARPNYADRPSRPPVIVPDAQGRPAVVPDGRVLPPGTRVISPPQEEGGYSR